MAGNDDARIMRAISDPKRVEKVLRIACAPKHKHGGKYRAAIRRHPRCLANAFAVLDCVGEETRRGWLDQLVRLIELLCFDEEQYDNFLGEAVGWTEANKVSHALFRYATCELALVLVEANRRVEGALGENIVIQFLMDGDMASRMLDAVADGVPVGLELFRVVFRSMLTVGSRPDLRWSAFTLPVDPSEPAAARFAVKESSLGDDPRFTPDTQGRVSKVARFDLTTPAYVYRQVRDALEEVVLEDRFPAEALACIEAQTAEGLRARIASCIGGLTEAKEAKRLRAWLPPKGLWRYAPRLAGCTANKMGVLGIVANSGDDIPEITLDVRLRRFDRERDERWVIGPSGVRFPDDIAPGSVREKFRLALALMCLEHIHDWVLRPPRDRKRDAGRRLGGGGGAPAPHVALVRLAHDADGNLKVRTDGKVFQASVKATGHSVEHLGMEPPKGMTCRMVPSPDEGRPRPVTFTVSDDCLSE